MPNTMDLDRFTRFSARIVSLLDRASSGDAFRDVLDVVLDVLESRAGFCASLDGTEGDLVCTAVAGEAFAPPGGSNDSPLHLPHETWRPLWGEALLQRTTVLRNQPHALLTERPPLNRSLAVPIIHRGAVLGLILVADREADYSPHDARALELMSRLIAPVLHDRWQPHRDQRITDPELQVRIAESEALRSCLARDLADQTLRAEAARQSLERLHRQHHDLLEGTPAVVYIKDTAGRYEFVNRRFEELFHVSRERLLGRTDFEVFPEPLATVFQENDRRVAETGTAVQCEEVAPHDDGPHTYLSVKFPLRDELGRIRSVAGISTDITDRIRVERELDAVARRLNLILDAVGDGVFGMDADGRTTFVNPTAVQLLGWTEEELVGRPIRQFLRMDLPLSPVDSEGPAEAAAPTELIVEDEAAVFWTKSGSALPVRFVCRALRDGQGAAGAVVTFRDLSHELRERAAIAAQQQLQRQQSETEQQLEAVRQLQLDLFAGTAPAIPGYDIAGRNYPQHVVSGDFFDYVSEPGGSIVIVVGDATGHDLPAAVHMVEANAALHAFLDCGVPLHELIERLNRTLCRHLSGRFLSLFIARLEPATGRLEFAGAGHDALLLRASGVAETLSSSGLVLGLTPEGRQPSFSTTQLEHGDLLLLSTDGFYEAQSARRETFGRKRVVETLRLARSADASDMIERLRNRVLQFSSGGQPQDDMTAVLIRRTE